MKAVNCDTIPVEIVEIVEIVVSRHHVPGECALDTIPGQRCCMLKHAFESSSLCCAKGATEPKENNNNDTYKDTPLERTENNHF